MQETRRQDIELLRIFSAFGIVLFHATGNDIAYSSLIIFVILSMFLAGVEKRELTVNLVKKRLRRLIFPWITWFVVYGAFNLVRQKNFFPVNNGIVAGILAGPSIHLWYMPFIFWCILFYDVVKNNFSRKIISYASPIFAALILFLTPFWREVSIGLGAPLAQYAHALAAIFIGIYFSYFNGQNKYFSIFVLTLIVISSIVSFPFKDVGVTYFFAILCSLLLISKFGEKFQKIDFSPVSQCMLGVYFVHAMVLELVSKLLPGAGLLIPFLVFLISTLAVYIAIRLFPKAACYWS